VHRGAAAAVRSIEQRLKWLAVCTGAGICPEGRHNGAAGQGREQLEKAAVAAKGVFAEAVELLAVAAALQPCSVACADVCTDLR
jgi:hypothetical protein